jgi:hypothetical protein
LSTFSGSTRGGDAEAADPSDVIFAFPESRLSRLSPNAAAQSSPVKLITTYDNYLFILQTLPQLSRMIILLTINASEHINARTEGRLSSN